MTSAPCVPIRLTRLATTYNRRHRNGRLSHGNPIVECAIRSGYAGLTFPGVQVDNFVLEAALAGRQAAGAAAERARHTAAEHPIALRHKVFRGVWGAQVDQAPFFELLVQVVYGFALHFRKVWGRWPGRWYFFFRLQFAKKNSENRQ